MESELTRNIYTFVNILSAAATELVKDLDFSSITSAFKWADYCMKIEEETRTTSARNHLDTRIQLMTVVSNPVTLRVVTLEQLKEADLLFFKTLLQNPDFPQKMLNKVVDTFHFNTGQFDSQRRTKSENRIYLLLGEDTSFNNVDDTGQASIIMSRLVALLKLCCCQKRFQLYLGKVVKELQSYRNGWNLMLHMFLLEVTFEEDHQPMTWIKETMLTIIQKLANDKCGLWSCDACLLVKVSSLDDRFCDMYVNFLMNLAQGMSPYYGLKNSGDMYSWKNTVTPNSSKGYEDLLEHILNMHRNSGTLRRTLLARLEEQSKLSYFNIYKDILKACRDDKNTR